MTNVTGSLQGAGGAELAQAGMNGMAQAMEARDQLERVSDEELLAALVHAASVAVRATEVIVAATARTIPAELESRSAAEFFGHILSEIIARDTKAPVIPPREETAWSTLFDRLPRLADDRFLANTGLTPVPNEFAIDQ